MAPRCREPGRSHHRTVVLAPSAPQGHRLGAAPRLGGCGSPPGTSTPSGRASTGSRRSCSATTSTCSRCQETKAREDQLPLMGLQAAGYDVAAAGTNQWNGVALISRVGLDDVTRRLRRHARVRRPAGGRVAGDRARPVAAYGSGRSTCPTAASPTTRTTSTSSTGWPGCARPPAPGWTARRPWSATGTSARPTTTSSTPRSSRTPRTSRRRSARPSRRSSTTGTPRSTRAYAPGYTYWDYYRQRFERDRGLKIDFVLATPSLAGRVTGAFIDREERAGQGASDHAPVVVDLSD